jgi:hypothetical protein
MEIVEVNIVKLHHSLYSYLCEDMEIHTQEDIHVTVSV